MLNISVVIPLYNKGPHIERTIATVVAQTLQPTEIIVVDDGSTDGGYEKVMSLKVPNLQVHRRSPPGAAGSAARNLGTQIAKGDWIALLDADDEWLPGHLEDFARTLSRSKRPDEVAVVFSGYLNVYPDGHREEDGFTTSLAGSSPDELDFSQLVALWLRLGTSPIWTSAVVVRRAALLEAGMFPAERCSRGEDKDTWFRVAHRGLCLPTKMVSAVYHRDAVNMATKLRHANQVPCIHQSIVTLLARSPEPQQQLLRRLANIEIYNYALATTKVETLSRDSSNGFFRGADPVRALLLELLSLPPISYLVRKAAALRRVR